MTDSQNTNENSPKKGKTIYKLFSEEHDKLGKSLHEGFLKRKHAYVTLVKLGKSYDEIEGILKITNHTMTKYALETNYIASLSKEKDDFDRNLMYHCIKEYDVWMNKRKQERDERNQKKINDKQYQCNPDWWM